MRVFGKDKREMGLVGGEEGGEDEGEYRIDDFCGELGGEVV